MIRYLCPNCHSTLESPSRKTGAKINCPGCGQKVIVPPPPTANPKTTLGEWVQPPPNTGALQQVAPTWEIPHTPPPVSPQIPHAATHLTVIQKSHDADNQAARNRHATVALLELLGGLLCQTFGIGHIYAGNVSQGIIIMIGYWAVTAVNALLVCVAVGLFTWPLCWAIAMVASPTIAIYTCKSEVGV